jgi:hypothetical protein
MRAAVLSRPAARALAALAVALCWIASSNPVAAAPRRWRVTQLPLATGRTYSYAEPGIATGPDGLIVIDAASANTGAPPTYWISRNDGRSWATGRDFDPTGASTGDADAAIGPDAWLYALNLGYSGSSNPAIELYRSRNGLSWSGPAYFPPPHGLDQPDRPWLVVNPRRPANIDLVNSEVGGNIVAWRSFDHGARFTGPYPVSGGLNGQAVLALSSRPLFDPSGARLLMLYETTSAGGAADLLAAGMPPYELPLTQLWLASSSDGGATWANRLVLDTARLPSPLQGGTLGHLLVASAIDRAGDLYAAFSLRPSGVRETNIYMIHSDDGGASWSAPIEVPAPTRSNVMPALAVSAGVAYLSWYGSSDPDFRSPAARWSEMFASSRDPLAARPRFHVEQVTGRAPVHVGGIDTAGNIGFELGANWGLRDFQSIAVDACGVPHLAWASDAGRPMTDTARPQKTAPCRRDRWGQRPRRRDRWGQRPRRRDRRR